MHQVANQNLHPLGLSQKDTGYIQVRPTTLQCKYIYKYKCIWSNTNTEELQIIPLSGNNCGDRSVHEPQQQLPLWPFLGQTQNIHLYIPFNQVASSTAFSITFTFLHMNSPFLFFHLRLSSAPFSLLFGEFLHVHYHFHFCTHVWFHFLGPHITFHKWPFITRLNA